MFMKNFLDIFWHFLTVWNWGFFDLLSFLQICHFHIGSYAFDENLMKFSHQVLKYNDSRKNTILDYQVEIYPLKPEDRTYIWLNIGNYSLTGFEMKLARHSVSKSIFFCWKIQVDENSSQKVNMDFGAKIDHC